MKIRTYNSYKPVKKFLHRMNLLQGVIRIGSKINPYYIPICTISLHQLPHNEMLFSFDTLDTTTGNINELNYESFINYMHVARNAGFGDFKQHKVGPIGWNQTVVNYVSGEFSLSAQMDCSKFYLNKKRFYLIKILSPNEHSILLLCSPDTDTNWLNNLGINRHKLNKSNLTNILVLLKAHLFNQPRGVELQSTNVGFKELVNFENIQYKNNSIIIQTDYGFVQFSLKDTNAYIDIPMNASPRLTFKYKKDKKNKLLVDIILASKYRMNLISKLTR